MSIGEVGTLLGAMFTLIVMGIGLSGILDMSHSIAVLLAEYSRFEKPDPTFWMRIWERFYDRYIDPFGTSLVADSRSPTLNGTIYQVAIGGFVVLACLAIYIALSGITLGAAVVSYYSTGYVPNLSPVIEHIAAGCLLLAVAIVWHSTTKSIQTINHGQAAR